MKRLAFTIVAALVAAGPFNQKLSPDQQVIHVLNRLTFGPRPGDIEQVRRIGVGKWIELQLHPEQIPENPELETKLKSLSTLQMSLAEVVEKYTPAQQDGLAGVVQIASLNTLLSTCWPSLLHSKKKQRKPRRCARNSCVWNFAAATPNSMIC
jgi:hypothetical protein